LNIPTFNVQRSTFNVPTFQRSTFELLTLAGIITSEELTMAQLSRRSFFKHSMGATAAVLLAGACAPGAPARRTAKIGYITPQTGALASFGETDAFILKQVREAITRRNSAGAASDIEILVADSKSNRNRASDAAADLIFKDKVDFMAVGSTPETTNPVADLCETNGVPCLSSVAPWQPWYFRSPQTPEAGYQWTYHFFWGLEDIITVFLNTWESASTNKVVGGMWPNDGDGMAWSDAERGFPPAIQARGFKVVDPGRYANLSDDFSPQIKAFKDAGVEIVTGVMIPPDLKRFMLQASQQGFAPKFVTVGKAALFPSAVADIDNSLGDGLTTEIWWSPSHPFTSSLTSATAADLAGAYEQETKKQWSQPLGFVHALFEIAVDTLNRTTNLDDKANIRAALKATNLNTIVGPVAWGQGPTPNVAKTPLVGGQWGRGKNFPWQLTITSNVGAANIPAGGQLRLMPWAAS
jgi:branched-chain amino acid transport system substrate-binding protein